MISFLRTFLALARISYLPTVWSNCLAGWWLGGAGHYQALPFLLAGATCLYLGGAFLNDTFDAEFDRQHRRARPIPAGAIMPDAVRRWGLAWLALGELSLLWFGPVTGGLGLALICCILLYNAVHRWIVFSPVLLGICRFFLYVIGASTAVDGVTGWSIWCGLAVAGYLVGLGYFLPAERTHSPLSYWPVCFLFVPVFLALIMNANGNRAGALLLSAVLVLWVFRCLRFTLWSSQRELPRTISGLVAGIVFVDWLAVADAPRQLSALYLVFFGMAVGFQRLGPAS